jgi:hypothetical protein
MLAVPSAAGRKIGIGIWAKDWRNQRPAEHHQERKCNRPAHSGTTI